MNIEERIQRLEAFKELIVSWSSDYAPEIRSSINQEKQWVRREIVEAGCYQTYKLAHLLRSEALSCEMLILFRQYSIHPMVCL